MFLRLRITHHEIFGASCFYAGRRAQSTRGALSIHISVLLFGPSFNISSIKESSVPVCGRKKEGFHHHHTQQS